MTDWPSFIASLMEDVRQKRLDEEEAWQRFFSIADQSPHAGLLAALKAHTMDLDPKQRTIIAFVIARLLRDVEWPPDWEVQRRELLAALDGLLAEMEPASAGTAASQLSLSPHLPEHNAWLGILRLARHFLAKPCRRDELRLVVSLFNTALPLCVRAYRRAWAQAEKAGRGTSAMATFAYHLSRYDAAARNLNQATGEVLLSIMGPITPEY